MGRKSQFRNLGVDFKSRVKLAVSKTWDDAKLTGKALKLYSLLKPMEKHIDSGKCPYCTPLFNELKNCPDILALPQGADREAQAHILMHLECRQRLKKILDCPNYKREKN